MWERPSTEYLAAATLLALATLLRFPFEPWLSGQAPFAFYFPALVLVAWAFRVGPTLLAVPLAAGLAWSVVLRGSVHPDALRSVAIFLAAATALALVVRRGARTHQGLAVALHDAAQLQVDRARLGAIVDSSDDAILAKDLNGIVVSWNEGAARIFGYTASEMIGQSITRLIPEARRFEEDHILNRLRRGERIDHFETVRVAKDGRELDISVSVSPIRDARGEIVGASKIARDITERKRAERALAEQRLLLRVTLASIGDAVVSTDRDGNITYMNSVAERLSGWKVAEAQGKPIASVFRMVQEGTRKPVDDGYAALLRSAAGISQGTGMLLLARDGAEYPVEDRATPLMADGGTHLGMVVCFRDVSERRAVEAALAEQRNWLETTLVSIGDAVIATDIHGCVSFMNPVAEHLTGWKASDARGLDSKEVFRILNESSRLPVESPVGRVLREGAVVGLANHTILISRDGRELPIDDSAAPIRGQDGRIAGVVVVFHDVTERRQVELTRQHAEREREHVLQSERAARTEAERANRLKDEFLATVSHELRTPLSAILGWTDVLQRTGSDEATRKRGLSVIERNARIQRQLVSDLLDVSRIVAGKLKLELQLVRLPTVVEQAIESVRAAADGKHIQIERMVDPALEPLVGDPDRLQQVVWNLLSNAVKFSPDGSIVKLRAERYGQQAVVSVQDQGIGIAPDFLPHLFERFRQADGSTSRTHGGLGLGLTIVKQLVELHGGTISAESEGRGKGATFRVSLPLEPNVDGYTQESSRDSLGPAASALTSSRLQGLRVLVVEDDADGRELVERLLSEAGCRVTLAASAAEALEKLQQEPQDLVVSDIGLPGQDGYSLIAHIRQAQSPAIAHIPAIALTAFARSEDRSRALRAGFQAHVTKPLDAAELLATVTSFASLGRYQA